MDLFINKKDEGKEDFIHQKCNLDFVREEKKLRSKNINKFLWLILWDRREKNAHNVQHEYKLIPEIHVFTQNN